MVVVRLLGRRPKSFDERRLGIEVADEHPLMLAAPASTFRDHLGCGISERSTYVSPSTM